MMASWHPSQEGIMRIKTAIAAVLATLWFAGAAPASAADAPEVELTWMSISNWYIRIGDLRVVLDGYISRLPGPPFFYAPKSYPKDQYAYTRGGASVDQHFARELYDPPTPDANGNLRAGVGEDYPNGGGGRAYLFTVERPGGKLSFFVQTSASAFDLDKEIHVDGVNYGAPLANLAAAMNVAGLTSVDAWIGTGGLPLARLIVPAWTAAQSPR
jgi:hypothetical protein